MYLHNLLKSTAERYYFIVFLFDTIYKQVKLVYNMGCYVLYAVCEVRVNRPASSKHNILDAMQYVAI